MRRAPFLLTALLLLACRTDYDINEVAPPEHTGEHHDHDGFEVFHEHGMETTEAHHGEHHHHRDEVTDTAGLTGSDRHVHAPGVRNHGTEWFFNQPWAAGFIWGKMIRDSVILLLLAAAVTLLSGFRRKER